MPFSDPYHLSSPCSLSEYPSSPNLGTPRRPGVLGRCYWWEGQVWAPPKAWGLDMGKKPRRRLLMTLWSIPRFRPTRNCYQRREKVS